MITTLDLDAIEADLERQLHRALGETPVEPMISIHAETLRGLIAAARPPGEPCLHPSVEEMSMTPAETMREMAAAWERVLVGGNHLAVHSHQWPDWQLGGLSRRQQCESALRMLGATRDYDMWCCWSTIMQERETLAALSALPIPDTTAADEVLEKARDALGKVQHWASTRCPCENEKPDPCPLCGASVEVAGDYCLAVEGTIPIKILTSLREALADIDAAKAKGGG